MIRIALTATAIGLALMATPLRADTYQPTQGDRVAPSANGITLHTVDNSAFTDILFGAPFHSSMRMLVQVMGPGYSVSFPAECPAGPLVVADFPGQISVTYLDDKMVGWMLYQTSPLRTSGGVGLGTPLSYLDIFGGTEITDSSLGIEFANARLSGLLDEPDGAVAALWTGTNCIFR